MEKKNNGLVYCAVALFVMAFVLTLTHVFHVNIRNPYATACNDEECEFFRRFIA